MTCHVRRSTPFRREDLREDRLRLQCALRLEAGPRRAFRYRFVTTLHLLSHQGALK